MTRATSVQAGHLLAAYGPAEGAPKHSPLFKFGAGFICASVILDLRSTSFAGMNLGVLLMLVVTFALILRSIDEPEFGGHQVKLLFHDWAYLFSLGVMLASAAWSVSPRTSLLTLLPLAILWLASLLLYRLPVEEAVRVILIIAVIVAAMSLVAIIVLGDSAFQPKSSSGAPELRGVFHHQLRLGAFMALALGLLAVAVMNGDLTRIIGKPGIGFLLCVALLVAVLFMSRTRLYAAAAVLAFVLSLLLSKRGSRKWIVAWLGMLSAFPLAFGLGTALSRLEESGFDTGLTGRTRTWMRALNNITEDRELLGFGFGTFKLPEFDHLFSTMYRPAHAHSSYIQAYFETGMVGLTALIILVAAQIFVAWRSSVRSNRFSYSLFLVFYTALGSLTGLNYAGTLSAMVCLTLLFLAIESRAEPPEENGSQPNPTETAARRT